MTDWVTYRITSRSGGSSYYRFYLDGYVNYESRSTEKYVDTKTHYPFYNWGAGDYIEIDNDETRRHSSGYEYTNTSYVRSTSCHHGCGHSHTDYDNLKEKCGRLEGERNGLSADRDHWRSEYSKMERERNDLRNDRDEWRRKHDQIKDQLTNQLNAERSNNLNTRANERLEEQKIQQALKSEKTLVERDLIDAKKEITGLKKLVEDGKVELGLVTVEKDNQIALVKVELTEKESELKELEKSMADLRVDHEKENAEKELQISEKTNEIKEKEEKIQKKIVEVKALREKLGLSQEELLEEKIRLKQEKLENFAGDAKIGLEQIQNLCDHYEKIISSRLNYNRDGIKEAEKNISKIKQEISQSGIQMGKIQKFCHKCEKMAKLRSQLDQILSQQFEAKQEVPTNQ